MNFYEGGRKPLEPVYVSEKKIEEQASKALKELERRNALDLVDILGLSNFKDDSATVS